MKTAYDLDPFWTFLDSIKSDATRWLESLPEFKCPGCSQPTIFESGCSDCMDKDDAA